MGFFLFGVSGRRKYQKVRAMVALLETDFPFMRPLQSRRTSAIDLSNSFDILVGAPWRMIRSAFINMVISSMSLKKSFDGATHLLLSPLEFIEQLRSFQLPIGIKSIIMVASHPTANSGH
jgi:hypothetical protein